MTLRTLLLFFAVALVRGSASAADNPLCGQWSMTLPTQEAGWLAVREEGGRLVADLMWAVGAARPIDRAEFGNATLTFVRSIRRPLAPKEERATRYLVTMRAEGDTLRCSMEPQPSGPRLEFSGKRQPPLPKPPDLTRVKLGQPIALFNGQDLTGWRSTPPEKKNGWSVRDGILCNDTPKTDFGAYGEYANLRSDAEFEDFQLHIEYRLPAGEGGNSGIYLRGLYEVQVTHRDSKMQGVNGPGAVFGRIKPTLNAGRRAGDWESLDIMLVDRHVTIVLNGSKVIDNQPVEGCTGGALRSDVTQPGPIFLQGDHTAVQYRNITLRAVLPPSG